MESKRARILKYLEDHPDDVKGAPKALQCSIQYVYKVKRTQNRKKTVRIRKRRITNKQLALTIQEISLDKQANPKIWSFKLLKEALGAKGMSLSLSQLTRIMDKVGFSSKLLMQNLKRTNWYRTPKNSDKKKARRFRNMILMLDVIEINFVPGIWHKSPVEFYTFMTMRGELFLLAKFGKPKEDMEIMLTSLLTFFQKHKMPNKLIVVSKLIRHKSQKLKEFLEENESQIELILTEYYKELLPERYIDPRQFTYEKEEKEKEDFWKNSNKIDAMSDEEILALIKKDETPIDSYDNL